LVNVKGKDHLEDLGIDEEDIRIDHKEIAVIVQSV
jgi:hypothetical protein